MDLLWTDFLNSEWHDWRGSGRSEDRLLQKDWIENFVGTWNLCVQNPPGPADIRRLTTLRQQLQSITKTIVAGNRPSHEDIAELNLVLADGIVTRKLEESEEGFRVNLVPLKQDWSQVLSEIVASFAHTLSEGEVHRIRICDNPDCLWIFYDETRNRRKRFCDDKLCGNLMKVRRFRAKNKDGQRESME